jgi:hypothetical protein
MLSLSTSVVDVGASIPCMKRAMRTCTRDHDDEYGSGACLKELAKQLELLKQLFSATPSFLSVSFVDKT